MPRRGRDPRVDRTARLEEWPGSEIVLGAGCAIGPRSRLVANGGGTLEVGPRARIGAGCTLVAHERLEIGEDAVLEDEVMALDFDHDIADVEVPIRRQGLLSSPVRIGAGARIGLRACVLRGVHVGAGARVLEHAVVTHDVAPGAVVGGVPARVVETPLGP